MSEGQSRRQFLGGSARLGLSAAGLALFSGCSPIPGPGRGADSPAARVATIGFIGGAPDEGDEEAGWFNGVRQGLRELGWVDGENLRIEGRVGQGAAADYPDLAEQLVRLPVDVIVAWTLSAGAAAAATSTLPIVMVYGDPDPVGGGLAASIQRPGGNVTGNLQPPREIQGKRLELLMETVPHSSRVAFLGPGGPQREALRETARNLGVQLQFFTPRSEPELELALEAIGKEGVDGMLVAGSELTAFQRVRIADFAAQRRLPAMYPTRQFVTAGGLMSYDANRAALYRHGATYVDRILRGAKPGDLPIEFPAQYDLVINAKTAAALDLTIPDLVLALAAETIH